MISEIENEILKFEVTSSHKEKTYAYVFLENQISSINDIIGVIGKQHKLLLSNKKQYTSNNKDGYEMYLLYLKTNQTLTSMKSMYVKIRRTIRSIIDNIGSDNKLKTFDLGEDIEAEYDNPSH